MAEMGLAGAAVAGSYGGAKTAQWLGNSLNGGSGSGGMPSANSFLGPQNDNFGTMGMLSQMNGLLGAAESQAMANLNQASQKAIDNITQAQGQQIQSLYSGLLNGNNAAQGQIDNGTANYNALNAPFSAAGYAALDAQMRALGLQSPAQKAGVSSAFLSSALEKANDYKNLQDKYKGFTTPFTAPTAPAPVDINKIYNSITPDQLTAFVHNALPINPYDPGVYSIANPNLANFLAGQGQAIIPPPNQYGTQLPPGIYGYTYDDPNTLTAFSNQFLRQNALQQANQTYQNQIAAYNGQYSTYQGNQSKYNDYQSALNDLGYSSDMQDLVKKYKSGSLF